MDLDRNFVKGKKNKGFLDYDFFSMPYDFSVFRNYF